MPPKSIGNSQTTLTRQELAQMVRVTSASDGRGRPLDALIADWAATSPQIRRVWLSGRQAPERVLVTLELQPVADSEETFGVWMAHCEKWRLELNERIGRAVDLEYLDPDAAKAGLGEADTLVYERAA